MYLRVYMLLNIAALKHLKFIICGSYVKPVWPPLYYTDDDDRLIIIKERIIYR